MTYAIKLMLSGQTQLRIDSQRQSYYIGDRVLLECRSGNSDLHISEPFTWSKNSVAITDDSQFSVTQFPTSARLVIDRFRDEDAGDYVCSRTGFTSTTATLNVIVPGLPVM